MKILFTKHAQDKFKQESYVGKLSIDKGLIKKAIKNPETREKQGEKIKAVLSIDKKHLL